MMTTRANPDLRSEDGFTLVEVMLAVAIGSMVLLMVTQTFQATLQTQDEIQSLTASNADAQRILTLFERDLEGLWHHNVDRNQVLVGTDRQILAEEADFIDFLTTSDAITGVVDNSNSLAFPSVCEVGYWLRANPRFDDLIELWRREDPLVDDDIRTGGKFQLVSDRLKWFKITYFETVGYRAEPRDEWDSAKEGRLPRRIQLEFEIERDTTVGGEVGDIEEVGRTYVRHFTFDQRYETIMSPGVALVPVVPPGPPSESGGSGGGPGGSGPGGATSVTTSGAISVNQVRGGERGVGTGAAGFGPGGPGGGGGRQGQPPAAPTPPPIDIRDLFGGGGGGGPGGIFSGLGG